jgi:phage terminase large subunit-like protein
MTYGHELSMAQRIALLPPEEREATLEGVDAESLIHDWAFWRRPSQTPPSGDWVLWLAMAGRGWGKTRTAAEWINERVRDGHGRRIALLGRTAADVRDVMVNGPSGIIESSRPGEVPVWEPSKRRVSWPNGAYALAFSADEPDQLRGPQFDTAWCVAEGEPVLTSLGPLPIEQIQPGMKVLTRSGFWPVARAQRTGTDREVVEIEAGPTTLRCTPDHLVLVASESRRDTWVQAADLEAGDMVHVRLSTDSSTTLFPVASVRPAGRANVYDLTINGAPEFYAAGVLIHNCDEFASYPQVSGADGLTAFANLRLGLRLPVDGDMPRMVATTTPRRVPSMFQLLEESENPEFGIVITRGTTYDNLANLAQSFRATILGLYEGTRIGQQELMGEMLHDIEGALFMQSDLDAARVTELPGGIKMHTVIGVDPSVAERPKDEAGIVVVKGTAERDFYRRQLYVVEDATVLGSPAVWAKRVVDMAIKWGGPVVAEGNQGGELVRMAIGQVNANVPVYIVHARAGKATRAEPVAALAEQGRLHMLNYHPLLESEITSWVPAESKVSPGRLDAMVWASLALTTKVKGASFAVNSNLRARSMSAYRLPPLGAANLGKRSPYKGRR